MKGKKIGVAALGVAAIMSLSFGLFGCEKKGSDGPSLVTDETLADKFVAMFTFEDDAYDEDLAQVKVPAVDPYTGEALENVYAAYDSLDETATNPGTAKRNGESLAGSTSLYLTSINESSFFPGSVEIGQDDQGNATYTLAGNNDTGISFSFWYNSAEAANSDWDAMITSEFTAGDIINYGNLSWVGGSAYPSGGAVHGRAAYTDTSYAAAQEELALGQLRSSNAYTVYNAMCPELGSESDSEYIAEMGNSITDTWLYMTVVVTPTHIDFYRDGVLAYSYTSTNFAAGISAIYTNLYMDLLAPGLGMRFFGSGSDAKVFSVDELLVGKDLTAAEVEALYENVSGETLTEADTTLSSSVTTTVDQALNTYGGCQWYDTATAWAQAELPAGDLNFTWTADMYTDASQVWYGPTLIMFEKIEGQGVGVQNTPAAGGVSMVYIRSDNYAGMCANLSDADRADGFEAGVTDVTLKTIEFTTPSTPDVFRYTLADEVSYTKTDAEEGVTTNLHEATPVSLVVNVVRTGNTWTVTYYKDSVAEANVIWAFTFQYSATTPLIFNIGGEGVYMTDITITNNVSGGAALTVNKTTVGTATPVNLDGFTEA